MKNNGGWMKKMEKMEKTVTASMSMLVLLALLGGCAHTSQGEVPSIDHGTGTDTQTVEAQSETNIDIGNEQDAIVFIDEKLDEICSSVQN